MQQPLPNESSPPVRARKLQRAEARRLVAGNQISVQLLFEATVVQIEPLANGETKLVLNHVSTDGTPRIEMSHSELLTIIAGNQRFGYRGLTADEQASFANMSAEERARVIEMIKQMDAEKSDPSVGSPNSDPSKE